ncbi:MAG: outer membrane lipoprotein carrier protein LolA [Polyangiales bacterium]
MNHRSILLGLALALGAAPALANPPSTRAATQRAAQQRNPQQNNATRRSPRQVARQQPRAPQAPQAPAVVPAPQAPQAPAAPNGALTAQQIVQRIQDFYDRTTNFQADFTQVSRSRLTGEEQRAGRVIFKRPGRMRWNYSTNGDVIVSNGTTLLAYQAEERQAIEQSLTQSQMPTALAFLTGTGRLADAFTFRLLDANQFQYPSGYVLEARPTTPQPTYERVVFYVDRASYQVTRTALIDAQGNTNRIEFRNPQVNLDVPESTFSWRPPADVRIVRP